MKPSPSLLATARAHTPLIHFLGKRTVPTAPHVPHPHACAPPELKADSAFQAFLKKMASSSATSASASSNSQSSGNAVKEFWEMPKRFWGAGSGRGALDEWEIDSIMSGGASNYTPRR